MSSRKIYFYPVFIICFIFLIDKASCIPSLREAGRRPYKAGQNVILGLNGIWKQSLQKEKEGFSNVAVFGTSRSNILNEWENIPLDSLSFQKKNKIETRSIVKASDFFLNYLLIKTMKKSEFKPDLVFLEFSEEMLNENSPYTFNNKWEEITLSEQELMEVFPYVSGKIKTNLIFKLLFPSYNYHFQPTSAILNLIQGKNSKNSMFIDVFALMPEKHPFDPKAIGFRMNQFPESDYQSRIIEYSQHLLTIDLLRNYTYSENEENIFKAIIDELEKNNIPTVIWEPQVHPYYLEKRKQITGGGKFQALARKFIDPNSKNIKYVSLIEEPTSCDYFTDSSHMSPLCVPDIAEKLFKIAKTIPNYNN